ncbi:hypothetical protein DPMN_126020 [Dreissena polymorpha]|uniref:Uncharacterized protein n=1 Tax=Dreissena polymorpha TaxID=45954 RepID=A0A9D4GZD4_DREPO|nr:hypothetical protein DPMN_126020 [Dreissena polymorpha]
MSSWLGMPARRSVRHSHTVLYAFFVCRAGSAFQLDIQFDIRINSTFGESVVQCFFECRAGLAFQLDIQFGIRVQCCKLIFECRAGSAFQLDIQFDIRI